MGWDGFCDCGQCGYSWLNTGPVKCPGCGNTPRRESA